MKSKILKGIVAGIAVALLVSGFFVYSARKDIAFGATIPTPVALFETSLASSISSTDTSMTLVSGTDKDGTVFAGETYGFIIDEGSSNEEFVIATCTGTSCTSMTRGVSVRTGNTSVTALKKSHRRGASVKITDAPILLTTARILNGDDTIPNPIGYASGVAPIAGGDFADKEYVDSVVNGGTLSYDQIIVGGNAGETVSAGQLVFFDTVTANEWLLADADTSAKSEGVLLGIAQGAGTDGNAITGGVLIQGLDTNQSGLTTGTIMYLSDTAGSISSSAGTNEVIIGIAGENATDLYFAPNFSSVLTAGQSSAINNAQGGLSSTNVVISSDKVLDDLVDQEETTNDSTIAVGEATLSNVRVAQSFVAGKTKVSGVRLTKESDTGSFTGTVTIALQADSSGSPSGSNLASVTITNADWLNIVANTTFFSEFSSEYTAMTIGSTYWIVVTTSTSDSSNHPNLGTSSSGGYASGSVKAYDGTSWSAVATIDLTFSTFQGITDQVVGTNSSGVIQSVLKKPTVSVITSTGIWTKPDGLSYIYVELVGGGGGGGDCNNSCGIGGGGGAGGYASEYLDSSVLSSVETVTVGAGGTAGSNSDGGTGGTSSFGTSAFLQATGGSGGSAGGNSGRGGLGSNGDFNVRGAPGGSGYTDNGSDSSIWRSPVGGSSLLGGGSNASGSGSCGGGGNGTSGTGVAGQAGCVVIHEFY